MTWTGLLPPAMVALAVMLSAPAAFALPQCTYHDRLVQKINEAYNTQSPTNCDAPLDRAIEEVG